jgi:hypothetical protein
MVPLSFFLLLWCILLGIFGLMAFVSMFQMLRYGITGAGTTLPTILFLCIVAFTILGASAHLVTVDWTQSISLFENPQSVILLDL